MPLVVTTGALDIGAIIIEVAGLSFLGFGAQPPTPEWGLMLNEGRQYLQTSPWLMVFPGMSILIVVSIFNLWSDSLRDVVDPKNQGYNCFYVHKLDSLSSESFIMTGKKLWFFHHNYFR